MALRLVDASASRQDPQETAMTEPLGQSTEIGGRSTRDWTRARDRRSRFSNFLAYVAGGLSSAADTTALRGRLEHGLRELVPVRSVQIRNAIEGPARPGTPPASEVIVLDVPTSQPARQANLEVAFDPACGVQAGALCRGLPPSHGGVRNAANWRCVQAQRAPDLDLVPPPSRGVTGVARPSSGQPTYSRS